MLCCYQCRGTVLEILKASVSFQNRLHFYSILSWSPIKVLFTFTLGFKMCLGWSDLKWTAETHCRLRLCLPCVSKVSSRPPVFRFCYCLHHFHQKSPANSQVKTLDFQHTFIISLFSNFDLFKTTTMSCINVVFSCNVFVDKASGHISTNATNVVR